MALAVSATTRKPREGEVDGSSYYFLSEEEFAKRVEENAFVEWDGHFGKCYGTLWSEVTPRLEDGQSVILEIDVNGAANVRNNAPNAVLIFIAPPSLEQLEERLRSRGSESEEQIAKRLERVQMELESARSYDEVLVNDDLDAALVKLEGLIDTYETDERKQHVRDEA